MWTKREKIPSSLCDIEAYLDEVDNFHDYKLGGVEFNTTKNQIIIEGDMQNKNNEGALAWDFTFESISDLKISVDMCLKSYISEITVEDNFFMLSLTNGYISFKAVGAKLGVPMK